MQETEEGEGSAGQSSLQRQQQKTVAAAVRPTTFPPVAWVTDAGDGGGRGVGWSEFITTTATKNCCCRRPSDDISSRCVGDGCRRRRTERGRLVRVHYNDSNKKLLLPPSVRRHFLPLRG